MMGYGTVIRMAGGGLLKSVITKALILGVGVLVAQGVVGSYLDTMAMNVALAQENSWIRQGVEEDRRLSAQAELDRSRIDVLSQGVSDELEREKFALYKRGVEASAAVSELPECPALCKASMYLVGES